MSDTPTPADPAADPLPLGPDLTILGKQRLQLKQRMASAILNAMADREVDFAAMDTKLEVRPGTALRMFNRLASGMSNSLDEIAMMCFALGGEMKVTVRTHDWDL